MCVTANVLVYAQFMLNGTLMHVYSKEKKKKSCYAIVQLRGCVDYAYQQIHSKIFFEHLQTIKI